MIRSLGIRTQPLTMELAVEFSTMPEIKGERGLKKKRLEFLKDRIRDGLFHSPTWAVAFVRGKRFRINGKHSSTALSQSKDCFPQGLHVAIEEFQCESESDLAELFEQFDNSESVRDTVEVLNAHARVEPLLSDVAISSIRRAVDGVAMEYHMRGGLRLTKGERAAIVHTHQDFIIWFQRFASDSVMSLSTVAGAVYATWAKDAVAALEFWSLVKSEEHPDVTHPTRQLSRWLREVRASKVHNASATRRYTNSGFYERCIHAWNCYRRGGRMKQLRAYSDKKGQIATPI